MMDTAIRTAPQGSPINPPGVGLWTIFAAYFQVGLTAFGMAILQKLKKLVLQNHWLTEDEMNDGLAMVQLYPGPIMVDFTAYAGYKLRGVPGALMATLGFITPTTLMVLALSEVYFRYGSLPWVQSVFVGLEALVIGVVLNVTLDFGQRAVKGKTEALIMLAAFAGLAFKINAAWIVLAALLFGAFFIRRKAAPAPAPASQDGAPTKNELPGWSGVIIAALVVLLMAAFSWLLHNDVGRMGLSFFKIGSIAFGNGMTILPLVQSDAVETFHWLSPRQFVDGIAISQITPGPFLVISTFIGYKLGGVWAALLATFAMFSPSFVMTLVLTKIYGRVQNLAAVKGALAGVLASFVGMLAMIILQLGRSGIDGAVSLVLAAAAFVAVRWFKLDILWVFFGGLVVWAGLLALGIV